ncbi:uncharacterized protein LOC122511074 isoform X1 [Leptopilina heterotoma]|uniref:uncharacterized protein LOC122511074 isoform X1 n=1 Tax=Leptopilina heterotoma TaxID=63436 RepID=UPI001CA8AE8E|nr:uncharacterized protein LOC122511074 isoform X1 [Leptopilina heterotoma]XP_043482050.1 uncharacterized protein LOC122511074 isoform X1 [Leptopilina heterotoma]
METLEDLSLYFYIACGIAAIGFLILFILITILFVKVKRLTVDDLLGEGEIFFVRSNQLNRQVNMMSDFCYTNPTIVPGEELSRRGFSMYSGADHFGEDFSSKNKYTSGMYMQENRSKF